MLQTFHSPHRSNPSATRSQIHIPSPKPPSYLTLQINLPLSVALILLPTVETLQPSMKSTRLRRSFSRTARNCCFSPPAPLTQSIESGYAVYDTLLRDFYSRQTIQIPTTKHSKETKILSYAGNKEQSGQLIIPRLFLLNCELRVDLFPFSRSFKVSGESGAGQSARGRTSGNFGFG